MFALYKIQEPLDVEGYRVKDAVLWWYVGKVMVDPWCEQAKIVVTEVASCWESISQSSGSWEEAA